ncbi:hypothetical protein ASG32_02720 [Methylobacterium sp. Leaf361]|uniref:hypothetical protein n=1 Tax=Methylobacterium sp. Leaf361 TaxID=1736352 RepID=UPI0006F2082C|nr:hypothetical protein [Methylobacterium sp. Leaf361]KQS81681.1 hypothetical protein ASG32_02720 [Methylobacterium sp. Leaf361]
MSVFDWSTRPAANAVADAGVPALDGASARELPGLVRDLMAAFASYVGDQGGAIQTGGIFNAYVARTASGVRALRPGIAVLVQADRDNTDAPTLNVDGTGARPWLDLDGSAPPYGAVRAGAFYLAIASGPGWVSDFGGFARSDAEDAAFTAALIFGGN